MEGTRATPEVIDHFRKTRAGALILFRRNFESAQGLCQLITDLELALGRRLLVLVDHEGGRIIHLGEGVSIFPDAQAAARCGRVAWVRRQGEIEARELRRLGIDVNLAPVLDVLRGAWNPAIGTRSYGEDAELVGEMGRARIEGMQTGGISACAKHYPGLGEAREDPHSTLPMIRKSWKAMRRTDLVPFQKAIQAGVDCIMSSHPVYSELDPKAFPATFSRRIIHDCLRLELGFEGVVLTDDLKMGALSPASVGKKVSLREAGPLAVKAGHDILLVCSDPKSQREVFDSLAWAYKKKDLKLSELEASVERIKNLKEKRTAHFSDKKTAPEKEGKELAQRIARGGVKILQDGRGLLPLSPAWCLRHSLLAIFPNLRGFRHRIFIEPDLLDAKNFLKRTFFQFGITLRSIEEISIDPDAEERGRIKELARQHDLVFFFCGDAHLFQGTRALLKGLQEQTARLGVILLREPHDLEWVGPKAACVTGYGFRILQIEAAVEKLFSPA